MKAQLKPRLFLTFNCGCHEKLNGMEEAMDHAEAHGHKVTINGSLTPQRCQRDDCTGLPVRRTIRVVLQFSCGCGFLDGRPAKAREHVMKKGDKVKVYGKIIKL